MQNTDRADPPRPVLDPTHAFAALGYRNYRLYFIGQFISMCGTWLQMVAEGWLVWRITHDALQVGLVTAIGTAPMFLLALAGGAVADRVDRKKLILVTQTCAMVLAAVLGWLAMMPWLQVWHVALVAALLGTVSAFDVPTRQAFVVQSIPREALMNAIALNSLLVNGARIIGPALGSALLAIPWIGVSGCYFLNSASYLGALIAIGRMQVEYVPHEQHGSALEQAVGGLRYVFSQPLTRRLITLIGIAGVFGFSISVLLAPLAEKVLRGNAATYGVLMTANGIGAVIGSLLLASLGDTPHKRPIAYSGLAIFSVSATMLSFSHHVWAAFFCLVGAGLGMILFFATSNTVLQSVIPDELRGRVMGVWALVFAGSTPLGSLLAGTIAAHWGVPPALRLGAGVIAISGALLYNRARQEPQPGMLLRRKQAR
jgi:MFS family permease